MKRFFVFAIILFWFCSCNEDIPEAPTSVSPFDGTAIEGNSTVLSWNACDMAISYHVQVCTEENFSVCNVDKSSLTETSLQINDLGYAKRYYWRIAAVNNDGASEWSAPHTFVTLAQKPVLLLPANGAVDECTSTILTWEASEGAEAYDFFYGESPTFNDHAGIGGTTFEPQGLQRKTTYYWQVGARCEFGVTLSEVWSFTTDDGQCPGIPTVTYMGKTYNTVLVVDPYHRVPDQCWMRENLDVGTLITGDQYSRNNSVIEKYYYQNDPAYGEINGGLYQWFEAMQYTTIAGAQGICPAGWHIPTREEFEVLRLYNHRDDLLAVGQLSGNNSTGFSMLLVGSYSGDVTFFDYPYNLWSSTESAPQSLNANTLFVNEFETAGIGSYSKEIGFPVRCIKDK